jgi:glycosyltransferase involved in cell wall biosynthesis
MLVSILIPCFNAECRVAEAIESALGQTWPEKEIIVVDDGSQDRSLEVIKSFGKRIRWETGPNRGGNMARNRLLELARGEWLQYLDSDDYLLPLKIQRQVEFLRDQPKCDVVYSPVLWVDCSRANVYQKVIAIDQCGRMEAGPAMLPGARVVFAATAVGRRVLLLWRVLCGVPLFFGG